MHFSKIQLDTLYQNYVLTSHLLPMNKSRGNKRIRTRTKQSRVLRFRVMMKIGNTLLFIYRSPIQIMNGILLKLSIEY